jgi:hypothetical protein
MVWFTARKGNLFQYENSPNEFDHSSLYAVVLNVCVPLRIMNISRSAERPLTAQVGLCSMELRRFISFSNFLMLTKYEWEVSEK